MKLYSNYLLDVDPKAVKIIDWDFTEEQCIEHVYLNIRIPQSKEDDNWFRNLKLVQKEKKISPYGIEYNVYHITYERKHEYAVIEIDENEESLLEVLKSFGVNCGITCRNNKLWLEDLE